MGFFDNYRKKIGISIRPKNLPVGNSSKRIVTDDDGSTIIDSVNPLSVRQSWNSSTIFTQENDLINKFRDMSLNVYCSRAIDQIVTECISNNDNGTSVNLDLDQTDFAEDIKDKILKEFEYLQKIMNFKKKGESIFREFFIDGRIYFIKNINKTHPEKGIVSLSKVDSLDIKKIKQVERVMDPDTGAAIIDKEDEFFLYQPADYIDSSSQNMLLYTKDSVAYANSGLYLYQDETSNNNMLSRMNDTSRNKFIISYLYSAIKPLNQLDRLEEAQIIYRVSRSADRRVHYLDISGLPKSKADQAIKDYGKALKNDIAYDPKTGDITSSSGTLNLQEDLIIPRRNGTNTAEVTSLPGATEIDRINDIEFFLKKLYKAMRVPLSRLNDEAPSFLGRSSEINRDELNFSKFCNNLRSNFDELWLDLLKTQLILKNIISLKEWKKNYNLFNFRYSSDTYISQLREMEMFQEKITALRDAENYVGKYFSQNYINKHILGFTDEEVDRMKEEISQEAGEKSTNSEDTQEVDTPMESARKVNKPMVIHS